MQERIFVSEAQFEC